MKTKKVSHSKRIVHKNLSKNHHCVRIYTENSQNNAKEYKKELASVIGGNKLFEDIFRMSDYSLSRNL
jgi:hypothetical protein